MKINFYQFEEYEPEPVAGWFTKYQIHISFKPIAYYMLWLRQLWLQFITYRDAISMSDPNWIRGEWVDLDEVPF
jgi:hypothetical protein